MTKDEVAKLFLLFKTIWRDFVPQDEWEATAQLNAWHRILERRSYKDAEWAAHRCMESCTFPPIPADLMAFMGTEMTLNDKLARLPMKDIEPTYADETHMEAAFMRLMRDLNKAKPMVGNQPPTVQEKTEGR